MKVESTEISFEGLKAAYAKLLRENEELKLINSLCLKEVKLLETEKEKLVTEVGNLRTQLLNSNFSGERNYRDA
jgi:hypothetical protein